jgi:hypothetical protein
VYRIPIEESYHATEKHIPLDVLHDMYGNWFCDFYGLPFAKESGVETQACGAFVIETKACDAHKDSVK